MRKIVLVAAATAGLLALSACKKEEAPVVAETSAESTEVATDVATDAATPAAEATSEAPKM
jgi:outer membrane protein assembly factor BamE (lipoprotein component of BamABCDE complex)